ADVVAGLGVGRAHAVPVGDDQVPGLVRPAEVDPRLVRLAQPRLPHRVPVDRLWRSPHPGNRASRDAAAERLGGALLVEPLLAFGAQRAPPPAAFMEE